MSRWRLQVIKLKIKFKSFVITFTVPVTEVERLWSRFQQLGPNSEGTLPNEAFRHPSFTSDPLVRQVIILLGMKKKTENVKLSQVQRVNCIKN